VEATILLFFQISQFVLTAGQMAMIRKSLSKSLVGSLLAHNSMLNNKVPLIMVPTPSPMRTRPLVWDKQRPVSTSVMVIGVIAEARPPLILQLLLIRPIPIVKHCYLWHVNEYLKSKLNFTDEYRIDFRNPSYFFLYEHEHHKVLRIFTQRQYFVSKYSVNVIGNLVKISYLISK
jgi:hypothetical protein